MPLLALLALAAFASSLSTRILDPVVPEIARSLSTEIGTAALLSTAFALPCALGQPILGPLGDTFGKSRMIKLCLAMLALGTLVSALAPSIEVLFASRIVTGFASGGIIPLCFATVGDRFSMQDRQVALSRVLSAILLGQIGGAVGAGLIATYVSWRWVMALGCATAAVTLALVFRPLQARSGIARSRFTIAGMASSYARVLANPRAVVCYGGVFVEGMAVFSIMPFLAAVLEAEGTGSVREAGFVISGMAIGGILYTVVVGAILRRIDFLAMMRLGGFLCGAGIAGLALLASWPEKLAAFTVVGLGFYMIHNSLQTQASELAPDVRGAAMALHAFSFFLGQAIGPVLMHIGITLLGARTTLLIPAAVMTLLGCVLAAGFAKRNKPAPPERT
jgi:predicted MFS family arabinose efflux permease